MYVLGKVVLVLLHVITQFMLVGLALRSGGGCRFIILIIINWLLVCWSPLMSVWWDCC